MNRLLTALLIYGVAVGLLEGRRVREKGWNATTTLAEMEEDYYDGEGWYGLDSWQRPDTYSRVGGDHYKVQHYIIFLFRVCFF
jgi:hypothetical protein